MRTRVISLLALAGLLTAASGSPAARSPKLTPADRAQVGGLVDRFVKDVVRREDLAAGWALAGHDLRAGTTRAAWIRGTGVTVPTFPAKGSSFRDAWTGTLVSPGHAILALMLFPAPGHPDVEQTAMTVDVGKVRGRWLVDELYAAATFGPGGVRGPADFGAGAKGLTATSPPLSRGDWLLVGLVGAAVLAVGTPLGFLAAAKRRHRRALRAYAAAIATDEARRPTTER